MLSYRDHKGHLRRWEAVERVNCKGVVVIVPFTPEGEVLLTRQYRPVLDSFVVEFPAGLNDKGESMEEAARRELVEETGYSSDEIVPLAEGPVSSGLSTEVLTCFCAKNARPAPLPLRQQYPPDENENIEIIKTPISDVYGTLDSFRKQGDFIDIKVYGLLELAKALL